MRHPRLLALIMLFFLVARAPAQTASAPALGSLQIIDAKWASGARELNVTQLLRDAVKNDRLDAVANVQWLGDPLSGKPKQLTVTYEIGNARFTDVFDDGATLSLGTLKPLWAKRLADVRKAHPNEVVVLDAQWGKDAKKIRDVTDICQSMVSGDSLTIEVRQPAFMDPDQWNSVLKIVYLDGDKLQSQTLDSGATLQVGKNVTSFIRNGRGLENVDARIAELRKTIPAGLLVLDACWGKGDKTRDVSELCQSLVTADSLTIPVDAQAFGEPDHWNSQLKIVYSNGTGMKSETLEEGAKLQVGTQITSFIRFNKGIKNVVATVAELRKSHPTGLLVLNAQWGKTLEKSKDITELCQGLVSGDSLTFEVRQQAVDEPDQWNAGLKITYTDGSDIKTQAVESGATLQVGPKVTSYILLNRGVQSVDDAVARLRKKHPTGLLVLDARWGADAVWTDLTDFCQNLVDGDSLTVPVSADSFRESPMDSAEFRITCSDGVDTKSLTRRNGSTLQIGPLVTSFVRAREGAMSVARALGEQRAKYGNGLLILNARWGFGDRWQDVRDLLQAQIVGGKLSFKTGQNFPDTGGASKPPQPQQAQLDLTYWDGSHAHSVLLHGGETYEIALPGPATAATVPATAATTNATTNAAIASTLPETATRPGTTIIAEGDTLKVSIDELLVPGQLWSAELAVTKGEIRIPNIGAIHAAGLTLQQLQEKIIQTAIDKSPAHGRFDAPTVGVKLIQPLASAGASGPSASQAEALRASLEAAFNRKVLWAALGAGAGGLLIGWLAGRAISRKRANLS